MGRVDWAAYLNKDKNVLYLSRDEIENLRNRDIADLAEFLRQHPDIQTLDLSKQRLNQQSIEIIASIETLRDLRMNLIKNGDLVAKIISTNKHLTSLTLFKANVSAAGGKNLAANQSLRQLNLSFNRLGKAGVSAFAHNTTLLKLNVSFNKLKDKEAIALAKNSHLKELNISRNGLGRDDAIAFALNTSITHLDFSHNFAGPLGARKFIKNQVLRSLSLGFNNVLNGGAIALAGHPTLLKLDLANNQLTSHCASAFADNDKLVSLDLSFNKIGDAIGVALAEKKQYIELRFTATGISDATVTALKGCNVLETLCLTSNPKITSASAGELLSFASLKELDLSETGVGDAGAVQLAGHPTIRNLYLCHAQLTDLAANAVASSGTLEIADLEFNEISVDGAIALHADPNLLVLLSGNPFNKPDATVSVEDQTKLDETDLIKRVSNARAAGAMTPLPSLRALSFFALNRAIEAGQVEVNLADYPEFVHEQFLQ